MSQGQNALPQPRLEPGSFDSLGSESNDPGPSDHWTTGKQKSHGVGVPAVQLTTHAKSSTLYGRSYGVKSNFFRLNGLLLPFCIIMGLRSASAAIKRPSFTRVQHN